MQSPIAQLSGTRLEVRSVVPSNVQTNTCDRPRAGPFILPSRFAARIRASCCSVDRNIEPRRRIDDASFRCAAVAIRRLLASPALHSVQSFAQRLRKCHRCFTEDAQRRGFLFRPLTKMLFAPLSRIGNDQSQLGREGSITRPAYQRAGITDGILDLTALHPACELIQDLLGSVTWQHVELMTQGGALGFGEPLGEN